MIETILLDIDGVCNKFVQHVFRGLGIPYESDDDYPIEAGWDIIKAINMLDEYHQYTATQFWDSFTEYTWATMPLSDEFDDILCWAYGTVGIENVYFLSSPSLSPSSLSGKLKWIQNFAPPALHRNYLIGPPKHLCANPRALLLDDSDHNVEKFRQYGGQAILFPRPWNSAHGQDPLSVLE